MDRRAQRGRRCADMELFRSELWVTGIVSFFLNEMPTTEIYTLSLHAALPRSHTQHTTHTHTRSKHTHHRRHTTETPEGETTPLHSTHTVIPHALFCFKKKSIPYSRRRSVSHTPHLPSHHSLLCPLLLAHTQQHISFTS